MSALSEQVMREISVETPFQIPSPPPARRRNFLTHVAKLALIVGVLGLILGACEGLAVASLINFPDDSQPWQLLFAADRGVMLGLIGAALGAVSGAIDWLVRSHRRSVQPQA